MPSLTQEIMELQAQLQCIQNLKEEWKDDEYIKQIAEAVKNLKTTLSEAFGESLHRLDSFQPKESVLEKVLQEFPECMKVKNEEDRLPIQSCLFHHKSLKYIPLLAREGLEREIGGKGRRGGLLTYVKIRKRNLFILQCLACRHCDDDRLALNTMKELKKLGLLKKDDIRKYSLPIQAACGGKRTMLRFRFLLEWDPSYPLLRRRSIREGGAVLPFMYYLISTRKRLETVQSMLTVTMDLYPEEAGFLFQKNNSNKTAMECAFEKFGEKETMTALHEILSPSKSIPILHHALVHIPQKDKLFTKWFPWAFHLRNHQGRSLHQAIMAAGGQCIEDNCVIFSALSDEQVQEKDPITTLYPFAAVACGEDGDLERSFELLRRQPGVLDHRNPVQSNSKRTKKRKRSIAS